MMYSVPKPEIQAIADGLEQYYTDAWETGIKNIADRMARSQMGIVTGYIDQAKDTYASMKKESADKFKVTFMAQLKLQIGLAFSNKADVVSVLVTLGEKALNKLADKIPVPALGQVVSAVTSFAADKARDELHERSITETDKKLAAKSGAELQKFFTTDKDAAAFIDNATKQYKTIGNYINMLPKNITTFDDAITYPKSAFKVMQAASSLNVSLWRIRNYLDSMSERLVECQKVSSQYIETVRTKMPDAVESVLQHAYAEGVTKGKADVGKKTYTPVKPPKEPAPQGGGATRLADRVAHALAQGYYDAGNTGPLYVTGAKPAGVPKSPLGR
jgi:hypothetical protein